MIFAENNRISHRQLYRQIVLTFTAPFLLGLISFGKIMGVTGIAAIPTIVFFLFFYILFLIRQESCYVELKKTVGIWETRTIGIFLLGYLIFTAAYLLKILGDIVSEILVMDLNAEWSIFLALLVCSVGKGKGMQRRGRMADVMGGIFLCIMLIILVLCAGQGNRSYLKEMFVISKWSMETFVKSGYIFLSAFSGISLLPFLLEYVEKSASAWKPVMGGIITVSGFVLVLLVLLPAILGWDRIFLEKYPVIPLLAGVDLPGNVLARFDILWFGFLLFSLLFSIGSLLHYAHLVMQKTNLGKQARSGWQKCGLFVLIFILAAGNWNGYEMETIYGKYLAYIFLPGIVFIQILIYLLHKEKKKKRISVSVGVMLIIFMGISLSGCGGVEPEKRMYPLALGVDFAEEKYSLTYAMANLPEATGQEKPEEAGENTEILTIAGKDFEEIERKYQQSQEKYLDMGHLKLLVVGKNMLETSRWQTLLQYLKKDSLVGENIYLFQAEESEDLLAWQNAAGTSLGEYVSGIMENQMSGQSKRGVTLRTAYYEAAKEGMSPFLPVLKIKGESLEILWTEESINE